MSYEIFTGLKYNKATRCFDCASYSNNVWPKKPSKWTMDYYAKLWPDATEQELKAGLILQGIYCGNKYCANLKWANEYKSIAQLWIYEQGENLDYHSFESARALARFYDEYTKESKKQFVIFGKFGDYITRITKTSYFRSSDKSQAKIFEARTIKELLTNGDIKWLVDSGSYTIETL